MDERTPWSRHADSLSQTFLFALLPTLVLFLTAPSVGDALDVTPITPSGLHTQVSGAIVTGSGLTQTTQYDITGGTHPGGGTILFHSFGDFNVPPNNIANFLNKGAFDLNGTVLADGLATTNILARVTNPNPSSIFGTIQTNGVDGFGAANLFLMNPSGILFGPNASLHVGGSVSFTTAQYIRLFDGLNSANFYADTASDGWANSVLSVAPVPDFGFLNAAPAAYGFLDAPNPLATITVQGSTLSVLPGQSISLVGREVVIQGDTLPDGTVQQLAHLSAPIGRIQLATAASPGEFDVNTLQSLPNNPVDPATAVSFTSFGSISLAPGSSIGSGASMVFIKDGQITLSVNDATLSTADVSATPPDTDTIVLDPGSSIVTSNSGPGSGSDLHITAGNLSLDGLVIGSAITTENFGDGIGGNITAHVGSLSLANSASINSNNSSFRIGEDGNFIFGIGQGGKLTVQGRTGADSAADSVMLSNGSIITTQTFSSQPGGEVVIAAGDVHLDASRIYTGMLGPGRGGDVHITADHLTLENSSTMTTETFFLGEVGGGLFLNVGTLRLMGDKFGGSLIQSINGPGGADLDGDGVIDVFVKGMGGNITIQGAQGENSPSESVVLSGGSGVTSNVQSGSWSGGRISIRTTSLDLKEASVIKSSTAASGIDLDGDGVLDDLTGGGGDILVSVQKLNVLDGATITSSTTFIGDAPAVAGGTVTVEGLEPGSKAGSVLLSGQNTRIDSNSFSGVPGDLTINTETLTITNEAVISTGSAISGPAGSVGITAGSVLISAGGQIFSRSAARDAGQVTITANELTLDNGSIVTRTFSEISGKGGNVELNVVGTVSLTNGASINSQSETTSNGRAGDITITGGSLTLGNHAEITSSSKGTLPDAGDAGNVTITVSGSFTSNASTIATSAVHARGGDINITAQAVQLSNGTLISASSRSPLLPDGGGDAGNVTIHSGSTFIMQNSSITTEATQASGGRIEITAPDMIRATNSRIVTSVAGSEGDTTGGDITIDPIFVILQNSFILAQAFAGTGGSINIISNVFLADPASIVDASSQLGISGPVNIQAPVQNVSGDLVVLSQDFASAAALLGQQCAARVADGKFSTFVVAVREGLPVEPGGFLPSPSFLTELGGLALSGQRPQTPNSVAEGLFPQYDAKPLQLAKLWNDCRWGGF